MEVLHLMTNYLPLSLIRVKNSSRDLGSSLRAPNIQLVTVLLPGFCTPRMTIHMCLKTNCQNRVEFLIRAHTNDGWNNFTDCDLCKIYLATLDVTSYNISEWY